MQHNIENSNNTLTNLMREVSDRAARSADFIAPTNQLQIETVELDESEVKHNLSRIIIEGSGGEPTRTLAINDVCLDQIADKAGINVKTARRLQQNYPDVFDLAIQRFWEQEPANNMIRTHLTEDERFGTARAFVSERFKTFDNVHLLNAILPQLIDSPAQWRVVNGAVTDKRLYLRLKSEKIVGDREANPFVGDCHANGYAGIGENPDLPATRKIDGRNRAKGDVMALGIGAGNSEVGLGSAQVYQMYWTLDCLNGLQTERRMRQAHLTSARGDSELVKLLSDETIQADNELLAMKMRDVVASYSSEESFADMLDRMHRAAADVLSPSTKLTDAVGVMGKVLRLTKDETGNVLAGLMATLQQPGYKDQAPSRAAFVNATTAVANMVGPDEVDDWQKRGGVVLDMPASDWRRVAEAA